MPEEAVARAGGEEDEIACAGIKVSGAAMGMPVHLDGAAGLEVKAEGMVLVLGNFYRADAVFFEDETGPWGRCVCAVGDGLPGEQGD